jgi:flagellar biosynthetic protein FlhB
MAEQEDSSQEKTEEPTQKKLDKAKEEGQVPRSKELNTLLVLIAGSAGMLIFGSLFYELGITLFQKNFILSRAELFDENQMGIHLYRSGIEVAIATVPFFMVVLIAAFVGPMLMGGTQIAPKAIAPKFSRMNPIKGVQRMFSLNSLMELAKAFAKFLVVAAAAIMVLMMSTPTLNLLGQQSIDAAAPSAAYTLILAFFLMSLSMLLITIVDVPFQIVEHTKKLKMTHQEVKEEMKNTEGKPEIKSKIRQLQQEMAQGRMMSAVPDADVVITNPTHFAVALKYDAANMSSPKLVAKGADEVAAMIRDVARANDVPIVSYPILSRALFYSTRLEEYVPEGLYVAVAQVLAYVFQLKQYKQGQGSAPRPLGRLKIPEEYVDIANP